eukprot:445355-Hanusia_phi.AAC.1
MGQGGAAEAPHLCLDGGKEGVGHTSFSMTRVSTRSSVGLSDGGVGSSDEGARLAQGGSSTRWIGRGGVVGTG